MIKAETITHEAPPAPNWLDHCRSLATPGRSLFVLAILATVAFAGILNRNSTDTVGNLPATSQSQQSDKESLNSLTVQPVQTIAAPTTDTGSAAIQAAGGTPKAEVKANTTNPLGAPSTPSFNSTTTPSTTTQLPGSQGLLKGTKPLTDAVQSTVHSLAPDLQGMTRGLLGL